MPNRREQTPMATREPKKRRRDRGDGSVTWDKVNKCYTGRLSLGYKGDGTRDRPTVRGRTKTEVKEKLDKLREEINAGVRPVATYTVEMCVKDWLDSIERDPHTMETIVGQAQNWIYPKIGARRLKDFTATEADNVKFGYPGDIPVPVPGRHRQPVSGCRRRRLD